MVFSELLFVYLFLPLNLLFYFFARDLHAKNTVMMVFSLIFYAWGEPMYVLLLLGMALCDWKLAGLVGRYRGKRGAKVAMVLTCVVDLGLLMVFKYTSFFLGTTHALFGFPSAVPQIILPIGISFYTFQLLSYVVDVYRGEVPPQKDFRTLLLYVSLFHQCIAGPIVRYKDVSEELLSRRVRPSDLSEGITRFTVGLAKKAVLANMCGQLADRFMVADTTGLSGAELAQANAALAAKPALALWLGMLMYMLQIYLDFSAYSDMAIGMGRMIGFHYKENFDYPYMSDSVTNFWRRWHISLGSFFRDYVYIPLGGNRCAKGRMIFNMFVVWFLTGLWHGASWNFVLWGLYFFVFLVLEKLCYGKALAQASAPLRHLYLLAVVFFGWILFRFRDLGQMGTVLLGMFGLRGNGFTNFETNTLLLGNFVFILLAMLACTPLVRRCNARCRQLCETRAALHTVYEVVQLALPPLLLVLATAMLVGDSYNPFLYFQF